MDESLMPSLPAWIYHDAIHSYMFGPQRMGCVVLKPVALIGSRYSWECGKEHGSSATLKEAKRQVEKAYIQQFIEKSEKLRNP